MNVKPGTIKKPQAPTESRSARRIFRDAKPRPVHTPGRPRVDCFSRGASNEGARLDKGDRPGDSGGTPCYRPEPIPAEGYGAPVPIRDVRDPLVSRLAPEHYAWKQSAALLPPRADWRERIVADLPPERRAAAMARLG